MGNVIEHSYIFILLSIIYAGWTITWDKYNWTRLTYYLC
jgi:hypothetical protein